MTHRRLGFSMRRAATLSVIMLLGASLAGCADVLAEHALQDAQAKCARMGKVFVQDQMDKTELVVISAAKVSGHCADAADAPAPPPAG